MVTAVAIIVRVSIIPNGMVPLVIYPSAMVHVYMVTVVHPITVPVMTTLNGLDLNVT
jgi:hypothetical protein